MEKYESGERPDFDKISKNLKSRSLVRRGDGGHPRRFTNVTVCYDGNTGHFRHAFAATGDSDVVSKEKSFPRRVPVNDTAFREH